MIIIRKAKELELNQFYIKGNWGNPLETLMNVREKVSRFPKKNRKGRPFSLVGFCMLLLKKSKEGPSALP